MRNDLLDEAYVEHDGAKVLIAELSPGSPDDEFYDAKVKVLSELIKHHVKEEERPGEGMFAQLRQAEVDLVALGDRLKASQGEQLAAKPRITDLPPPETRRSYTGHDLVQSKSARGHSSSAPLALALERQTHLKWASCRSTGRSSLAHAMSREEMLALGALFAVTGRAGPDRPAGRWPQPTARSKGSIAWLGISGDGRPAEARCSANS